MKPSFVPDVRLGHGRITIVGLFWPCWLQGRRLGGLPLARV